MEGWLVGGAFVGAFLLTGGVRLLALRRNMLDIPNERSSHTKPTPRSGGIGFLIAFLVGITLLVVAQSIAVNSYLALLVGAIIVAATGYVDDARSLSPYFRLVLQLAAAIIGVVLVGGLPVLDLGFVVIEWGWVGHIAAVLGVVWLINLYNFMDGIDGIAASEAVFVGAVGGALLLNAGGGGEVWVAWILAAACLGFLLWNWSPARIFMGDVGSGFLGYTWGILILITSNKHPVLLWVWLILLGVFLIDTLVTLTNRIRRGERWHEAHRSHAYQHATLRVGSHARVTLAVLAINVVWLLPCAAAVQAFPKLIVPIGVVTILPLLALAIYFRAGTEQPK